MNNRDCKRIHSGQSKVKSLYPFELHKESYSMFSTNFILSNQYLSSNSTNTGPGTRKIRKAITSYVILVMLFQQCPLPRTNRINFGQKNKWAQVWHQTQNKDKEISEWFNLSNPLLWISKWLFWKKRGFNSIFEMIELTYIQRFKAFSKGLIEYNVLTYYNRYLI